MISELKDGDDNVIAEAPAVVAVVVTHDGGPWFEECLTSLSNQDYPNLSVLVIDTAGSIEALPRVGEVMPSAYVRRLEANAGFGAAANEVMSMVEGAPFLLLCHDDVALEPDVVRLLVEEAFRSNAGVVGPKLVAWGSPDRLLQVGLSADKSGVTSSHVDRGELDQEQHDAVRDVFVVPGACTLIRADLFHTLGGYDPAIDFLGEDLDLCWRAHIAGARVLVAPDARVQHLEALASRRPVDDRRLLQARHRLRTMLSAYGPVHLLRVLPQALLFTLSEMFYALITGHPRHAIEVAGAWGWNLRRIGELRRRRKQIQATRVLDDSEVRRLQVRGSARLLGFMRGELGPARAIEEARQELAELQESLADSKSRVVPITIGVTVLLVFASVRSLLIGPLPEIGSIGGFDVGPLSLLGDYFRGWHSVGFDGQSPAPTATAIIGLLGFLFVGAMGVLQHVLVLGAIPLGLIGIWKLSSIFESKPSRALMLVVYAAIPLPWNAIALGRWAGLVLYATAPWIVRQLLMTSSALSWTMAPDEQESATARKVSGLSSRPILSLGLMLAVVMAFVPAALLLVWLVAVILGLTAGKNSRVHNSKSSPSLIPLVAGAGALAVVIHAPWFVGALISGNLSWDFLGGVSPLGPGDAGIQEFLRFADGPNQSALGFGLLLAASLVIFIGKQWRFDLGLQAWAMMVGSWVLAFVGSRDLLPVPLPGSEVTLSFGGVGLALAVGLGMASFETDLHGERFGWRQLVPLFAAGGLAIGVLPFLVTAFDGRAEAPKVGLDRALHFLDEEAQGVGKFNVLWIGDSEALPMAGNTFISDVALGVSAGGFPELSDRWQMPTSEASAEIESAIIAAVQGQTDRLGRIVGPLGVRYVALVERVAPERFGSKRNMLPAALTASVARQLDLRLVEVDPAIVLYENTAWQPSKTAGARP